MMREPVQTDIDDEAFALLVACADWPASAYRDRAVAHAARALRGDWTRFLSLVERHHLAIMAADSLRAAGIEPPRGLAELAKRQKQRALRIAGEAVRLVSLLEKEGTEAAILKGPLLSQQVFGDIAMRHMVDLDLLVDWQDFRTATHTLRASGYELRGHEPPWDDWRIEPWRALAKDITLFNSETGVSVELHHRLKSPAQLLPGIGMAQARETEVIGGRDMRAFSRADLFVYLCVHASTSFWNRLKWLADIRALLAGMDLKEIEALQAHSETLGTERCTALGLLLCHRLWKQPIPRDIAEWPGRSPQMAELEQASLDRLAGPDREHTSIANSLDRRRLKELRADPAYRRAQLSELVNDRELLETVHLPRALSALYLPLRIWLFLRRKFGFAPDPRLRSTP